MERKRTVKIGFSDFWYGFDYSTFLPYRLLCRHYDVVVDNERPDYLFFSCFCDKKYAYLYHDCVRILYSGENFSPDFNAADYAIAFDRLTFADRYLRFPLYLIFDHMKQADEKHIGITPAVLKEKPWFCNYIYGNPNAIPERTEIFRKLCAYKQVHSAGRYLNNTGVVTDTYEKKLAFQRKTKFTVAFESVLMDGYVTEKIMHGFAARTVPIYYGDPRIAEDINPEAFINCHDCADLDAVVDRVKEIDNDDAQYLSMLSAPMFKNGLRYADYERQLETFLLHIFEQPYEQAFRRQRSFAPYEYERDLRECLSYMNSYTFRQVRRLYDRIKKK
ncbi:MAG: glycosyltransferase family 10 [Oscillospiraceae bacterium]|nr:glycosyltransferase family 10 [Oscillospiraceae bacterium]